MKTARHIAALCLGASLTLTTAVTAQTRKDDRPFHTYIYNKEYEVFMRINLYDNDVLVPGQEMLGQLPGYLQKEHNGFSWIITDARVTDAEATLQMTNDYGSEDLTAVLRQLNDSVYELRHESGSPLKVPNKGKWLKLPCTLQLTRRPSQ